MSSDQIQVPIGTLLTHREWVRRLARSLVRDQASADDLEQRTWLTALRRPPRSAGSARAWLARVVRSHALNLHRAKERRAAHEQAGARGGSARSAADVVAEAETHGRLVNAVLDLDEPYRTTVLLRFFENLPPRVVARRMSVPVETVRTRLRRSLSALRTRLAEGGGREAWVGALAPILGVRLDMGATAGASTTAAAGATGGAVMTGKATIIAAVGLGLAAGFFGGKLSGSGAPATSGVDVVHLRQRVAALESVSPSGASLRLAEQDRRILALEQDLAAALQMTVDLTARAEGRPTASEIEVELRRLRDLNTTQLISEAYRLTRQAQKTKTRPDGEAALRVCQVALERQLETEQHADVLLFRGRSYHVLQDRKNEEASFREALFVAGPSSRKGRNAAHELAYTELAKGDPRAAAEWYLSIARQPDAPPPDRAFYRYGAACFLIRAGETVRAREEYRAVADEFGDSEEENAKKWARESLKGLELLDREEDGR